jgi:dienelactone hydrolase
MHRRSILAGLPFAAAALAGALPATGASATAPAAQGASEAAAPPLFADNAQFWFETERIFGSSSYGVAQFGEVLVTSQAIESGNYDSWYTQWNATADRIAKEAASQLARGHRVSARDGYLRAGNYHSYAEFFLHENPEDPRVKRAFKLGVECYRTAASLFEQPITPVEIPYENTTLPGYFHRVDRSSKRRPTLILHTGFDGSAREMHHTSARAGVERGYNVLAFDGPGQYEALRRGLVFRPDWEKVITPVVDFLLKQPGVDPRKIALMGESLGGLLAPRAAAFEKRLVAVIANDGLYDYAAPHLARFPADRQATIRDELRSEHAPEIDQRLEAAMKQSPTARWAIHHGMFATGAKTPREYYAKVLDYNVANGIAEKISCPTLVCEAEDDMFFKGQPQMLYDHLTCPKTLIRFTRAEGAGAHCQVGNYRLSNARIFDWLDETLA